MTASGSSGRANTLDSYGLETTLSRRGSEATMRALVSEPITLATKTGEFSTSHVIVQDTNGSPVREGVVLRALVDVPPSKAITVRVQSSCLFSESFWATDCDCSLQLQAALRSEERRV